VHICQFQVVALTWSRYYSMLCTKHANQLGRWMAGNALVVLCTSEQGTAVAYRAPHARAKLLQSSIVELYHHLHILIRMFTGSILSTPAFSFPCCTFNMVLTQEGQREIAGLQNSPPDALFLPESLAVVGSVCRGKRRNFYRRFLSPRSPRYRRLVMPRTMPIHRTLFKI
jgi:hypothetical protein